MILEKGKNDYLIGEALEKFKKEYKPIYQEQEPNAVEYIEDNFYTWPFEQFAPDVLMQIYGEYDLESPKGSFYKKHVENIEKNYSLKRNIIDIGCGRIPTFANMIAKRQLELGTGTIKVYDPLLVPKKSKYSNMELNEEEFTRETDIKDATLLTGILPCEATKTIVRSAVENNIDFYIAMCGCSHEISPIGFYLPAEIFQTRTIELALTLLEDTDRCLVVETDEEKYGTDYPVLYTKKRS